MNSETTEKPNLKVAVARTLKWNVIDRVSSQILYAVTGIVLANVLSQEDFGLVAAILVFQAFASLFIDSGFSSALIQRKEPTRLDYSTVLWFNLGVAVLLYCLLFVCAPWIAALFGGDERLIPLSRVMFLTFILNASAIVQTNILMKRMDVRMVAVSNSVGLIVGSVIGIWMAVTGWGAWAIVWQTIAISAVKSAILWMTGGWRPLASFSWTVLKGFFAVGSGVMFSSFLNTAFQNISAFFIGMKVGLVPLGYYGQSDKWSKMGVMSLSQVLTASFLPLLSEVQDDRERYARMCGKTHRFTAYLLFPSLGLLIVMATPIFHTLFHTKWDPSISLFQILLFQGIFMVLMLLYRNFILGLGKARMLVVTEIVRDVVAAIAIIFTLPYIAIETPDSPVEGLKIFLMGQVLASAVTWGVTLFYVIRLTGRHLGAYLLDLLPYCLETVAIAIPCVMIGRMAFPPLVVCFMQAAFFVCLYLGVNALLKSKIQRDAIGYFRGRL
ncbi:MAG: lipopolysaccharide biosynthesis protein [Staphylococcus sp.]|nr:lipopolysaccharide biosynthesis protein [Staphylococcus sp.]